MITPDQITITSDLVYEGCGLHLLNSKTYGHGLHRKSSKGIRRRIDV
jgi:hypothetical protein